MKGSEHLIYSNEYGDSITFGFDEVYTVTDFNDWLDNDIVTSRNSGQDGESYISSTLLPREITIKGIFQPNADSNRYERELKRIFNPKSIGILNYQAADMDRKINVVVPALPEIKKSTGLAKFTIDLIAYDPFWFDREQVEYLAMLTPKFKFPLVIPRDKGIVFGRRRAVMETEVQNNGDVKSGFRVVFTAKGTVKNPFITNKITGEQIKVLYDMEKGDEIEVVNYHNKKQVYINGEKSFKHLDRQNSVFFTIDVGKNIMAYAADENQINLDVVVYFTPLYVGW